MSDTRGPEKDAMDIVLPRYEIEQGENWLRLLQKEGRSILDDTQNTQELQNESQGLTIYPSIVALSHVGIVRPSMDCFICIDLDGVSLAVKDMRNPDLSDRKVSNKDVSQRSSQLGIYRRQTGHWEVLQRRRLRILSPGDRICTSIEGGKPGGLCLEYHSGEKPLEEKNETLSLGLLTQPQDQEDETLVEDEYVTQTHQSVSSQKVEILGDDEDDDSDRTVCLEESNPLDCATAASQASFNLLATQPDSDEETDVEKKGQKQDKFLEASSKGRKEKPTSNNDALASVFGPWAKPMDRNSGVATKHAGDSDDDTDVGEVGQENDPIEDRLLHEKDQSVTKFAKTTDDKDRCNEETNRISSTLLSDPIEDSDDDTDTEGEKNVYLANHRTPKVQPHERKTQTSVSKKLGEAPPSILHHSTAKISTERKKEPLHTGLQVVELSPSLCAETEDPLESSPKFVIQESAPLLSPVKESTQDTESEKCEALMSPTMCRPDMQETATVEWASQTRKVSRTQKPPVVEQEVTASSTQIAESIGENFHAKEERRPHQMVPASTKDKHGAKEIISMDGVQESLNSKVRSIILPTEYNAIQDNRHEKQKDTMEIETEATVTTPPAKSRKRMMTNIVGNGEVAEKRGATTSKLSSEEDTSETVDRLQLDTQDTFYASATGSKGTPVATTVYDNISRIKERSSGKNELKENERSTEVIAVDSTQHNPSPYLLCKPTSPQMHPPNTVNEETKPRKSRRRAREAPEMQKTTDKGSKRARHKSSKEESSNKEELEETTMEETLDTASPTKDGTSVTHTPSSTSNERRTRNSDFSKSTYSYEASLSSEKKEGSSSARKGRRSSLEIDACLDHESPVRVLTTGIELTASQKNMIKRIGGVLLQNIGDAHNATHVIAGSTASSMRRTPKLMIGLCKTNNIVDVEWLIQSFKHHKALPSTRFQLLQDSQAEAQYNFEMRKSLRRAGRMRTLGISLLDKYTLLACPGVLGNKKKGNMTPPTREFRLIIEAAGASWVPSLAKVGNFSKLIIVVSKLEDEAKKQLATKKVAEALTKGAISKSTEEIFDSIMQQQFIP
ncbi:unnamed protein product [Cylindrotheca closterium]|uniref:BRCT domain-containing protein n=1 Tax=Cylindrotheca closterium TaxID=2856 RepID=A0AAD2CLJ0_9STRA|nr:unnamed protein product [Cylindrotheca closterium]